VDSALGLTAVQNLLADARTAKNGWHALVGLRPRLVFGRLAAYEDVNDAERPAANAASTPQTGRFETE
jgi:hypothetical protein